jgi:hypothetical protein
MHPCAEAPRLAPNINAIPAATRTVTRADFVPMTQRIRLLLGPGDRRRRAELLLVL